MCVFVCVCLLQVFVASKFDNRLKEFAERWEVDKYLSATGYLPSNVRPFFVALPKVGRTSSLSGTWHTGMAIPPALCAKRTTCVQLGCMAFLVFRASLCVCLYAT